MNNETSSASDFPLSVDPQNLPFVNFAMQQNSVPFISSLKLTNSSTDHLHEIEIVLGSDPPIFIEKKLFLSSLRPDFSYPFNTIDLKLRRDLLRQQVEKEKAQYWIDISSKETDKKRFWFNFEILAYNEWAGTRFHPEIIAAHVLPNDPAVESILKDASNLLEKNTGDASISGYQRKDKQRITQQLSAIFTAASRKGISYINPPASFEVSTQKIRTPHDLVSRKLGTCIDTTLLLVACFEQAGFNTAIIIIPGHAFLGIWLHDQTFESAIIKHSSVLLNQIGLNNFIPLESVMITREPHKHLFKQAYDEGINKLKNQMCFDFAIDLKMARIAGFTPLNISGSKPGNPDQSGSSGKPDFTDDDIFAVPGFMTDIINTELTKSKDNKGVAPDEADRITRWKRHLLDLTLRNRLLNFRETRSAIPLACPDIAGLEDALAANQSFRILPKPEYWDETDIRSLRVQQNITGEDPLNQFLSNEMAKNRLHSTLTDNELYKRLTQLERQARLGLEEDGANTLFLGLGFLAWRETPSAENTRFAPILLIPMKITRKSVQEGFSFRRLDEESSINVTLLEKLKCDYGVIIDDLDPLPEDDSGLDVPLILHKIQSAIQNQPGWTVEAIAYLSVFSFSKFLMWVDLEQNASKLKQNKIVNFLLEQSGGTFDSNATLPELKTLDTDYSSKNIYCPLPSDSTQLRAVLAAGEGHSYVLQGPPGTGKSQTITNLISHCLATEKRVLFVAQKRAALDVVHDRLTKIGLRAFCLELHSNKTTKEAFRNQLKESFKVKTNSDLAEWDSVGSSLDEIRSDLNSYVAELHKERDYGKNAYWALSQLVKSMDIPNRVNIDFGCIQERTADQFLEFSSTVDELVNIIQLVGSPANHPLRAVQKTDWQFGQNSEIQEKIDNLLDTLSELETNFAESLGQLHFNQPTASFQDILIGVELMDLLQTAPVLKKEILTDQDWDNTRSSIMNTLKLVSTVNKLKAQILEDYTDKFLKFDPKAALENITNAEGRWKLIRIIKIESIKSKINKIAIGGRTKKRIDALKTDLMRMIDYEKSSQQVQDRTQPMTNLFGSEWQNLETNIESLNGVVEWVDKFRKLMDSAPGENLSGKFDTCKLWIRLVTESRSLTLPGSKLIDSALELKKSLRKWTEKLDELKTLLVLDSSIAFGDNDESRFFSNVSCYLSSLSENLNQMRAWAQYQTTRAKINDLGLNKLVSFIEADQRKPDEILSVFQRAFLEWWVKDVLNDVDILTRFFGKRHDQQIERFQELQDKNLQLAQKAVFSQIAQKLPRTQNLNKRSSSSSEVAMLYRFTQGGRKSIRRLFKECPNALARYKPCVLMSPLSVAQFIGVDFPKFDMVIFDEASQMPTHEAIGAIARGDQLIVVGDSKQLPPTTFFDRQRNDDFDEEDLPEELESILEEVEASGIKPLSLNWHYRSDHESLITFSNLNYYDGNLQTFPSAINTHPELGVFWQEVSDGIYDQGKTRTNRKEAEEVVQEILRRLLNPKLSKSSLGVVTFSNAQQQLVEDMLDQVRAKHPEIESFFTREHEPVFVKNLETVQGDERDIILFSICYGPDKDGIIRMNFGPLNKKGGERRLNVAITRARKKLVIFSTLRSTDIDTSRTNALGVLHLKKFLDYAKRGYTEFVNDNQDVSQIKKDILIESICNELEDRDYLIERDVGCSGSKIDVGICESNTSGKFILGILVDGPNYALQRTAGDRDWTRIKVLKRLGWQLHRIWSSDWLLRRKEEVERLENAIKQAKSANINNVETQEENPVKQVMLDAPFMDLEETSANPPLDIELLETKPGIKQDGPDTSVIQSSQVNKTEEHPKDADLQKPYKRFKHSGDVYTSDFYETTTVGQIRETVAAIVFYEGPILFDSLCIAVASCWGMKRAGRQIRSAVRSAILSKGFVIRECLSREFIWTNEQDSKPYRSYRIPNPVTGEERSAEEICPEEIANAARYVLSQNISMDIDDLYRETAREFGINRLGKKVKSVVSEGVDLLSIEENVTLENNRILML